MATYETQKTHTNIHRNFGGYTALANAIIAQACIDYDQHYREVVRIKNRYGPASIADRHIMTKYEELIEFFHSDYFKTLTNLDPDALMRGIEKHGCQITSA